MKKEILVALKQHYNFKSDADFAKFLDIKPNTLSNWYARNTLDYEILHTKCVDINPDWLLTGKGEMLRGSASIAQKTASNTIKGNKTAKNAPTHVEVDTVEQGKLIPFYDADAAAGTSYSVDMSPVTKPSAMIEIGSFLRDSDSAIRVYGNSMAPNYPAGCVIALKQHTDSFIVPGGVYVVETRENRYLKRLYNNSGKTALRCISDNHIKHNDGPMEDEYCYPEFEIPMDEIIRMHRVVGVIKRNII